MEQKPPKPKFPQKIYRWFDLWETITDWFWVEPGSRDARIFGSGWKPKIEPNHNHFLRRRELRRPILKEEEMKAIQQVQKNRYVDPNEMRRITIDL